MLGQVQKVSLASRDAASTSDANQGLLDREVQERTDELLLAAAEVDYQEELIRQRAEGISDIHRDVNQIHGLFQDMSLHVSQQGQMLDNIEAHLISASERTRSANEQLGVASRRAPSVRQNLMCALLLVLLFLVMIALFRSVLDRATYIEGLSSWGDVLYSASASMVIQT